MEPHHGRRGKESNVVCGMNRAKQTTLLMLAMVASMALVLLWEAPFNGSTPIPGNIPSWQSATYDKRCNVVFGSKLSSFNVGSQALEVISRRWSYESMASNHVLFQAQTKVCLWFSFVL
jgi:hypothetical protein